MFLDQIVRLKQEEVQSLQNHYQDKDWLEARSLAKGRSLAAALTKTNSLTLIAEVKPASPSRGVIRQNVDPVEIALAYQRGGASAISVLTESTYFKGLPESLHRVKSHIQIPALRKDFLIDPIQVLESKLLGADAILLIAALLTKEQANNLCQLAHELGMEVLLEVHEETEIELALATDADVLGINNRNLRTLDTDLSTTEQLRPLLPSHRPVIGESGIHSAADAERLAQSPVDGVLVGEYLMRQRDPEKAVLNLLTEVNSR